MVHGAALVHSGRRLPLLQEAGRTTNPKNRRYKVTASTVIVEDGRILLVKQGRGSTRGRWSLPGGRVDFGERVEDAALRETLEESGYRARLGELVGSYQYRNGRGVACLQMVFTAAIAGGSPCPDGEEITDVAWFELAELKRLRRRRLLVRPRVLQAILADAQAGGEVSFAREGVLAAA